MDHLFFPHAGPRTAPLRLSGGTGVPPANPIILVLVAAAKWSRERGMAAAAACAHTGRGRTRSHAHRSRHARGRLRPRAGVGRPDGSSLAGAGSAAGGWSALPAGAGRLRAALPEHHLPWATLHPGRGARAAVGHPAPFQLELWRDPAS